MRKWLIASCCKPGQALGTVLAFAALIPASAAGQNATAKTRTSGSKQWTPTRTPDGHPDLQGIWSNAIITPLERPAELAGKPFLTEQEAVEYEKRVAQRSNVDRRDGVGTDVDVAGAYNQLWYDRGTKTAKTLRTSLIVDPPDGRIPPLTPEARKRAAERAEARELHPADGPEDRSLNERCIVAVTEGPPMLPGPYNNNYQIVQTPDSVVIFNEMMHDARIIPMNGRPHLPRNVHQWMGDSVGHWDGDTLVVDTTNFTNRTNFRGSSENLHLVERFTLTDRDTLQYEFTVDDPASFTRPWTAVIPSTRAEGPIFEYACHEGNYAMAGILSAARAKEKNSDAKKK
jgi:hypothetical protein